MKKKLQLSGSSTDFFLRGKTPAGICRYLEQHGIPTPSGKQKWSQTTVDSILANEKYKGDALLQKKFTTDFLTKKMKVNEGEVPQYYVERSHDAIIEPLEWDMVQAEISRRRSLGRAYSGNSVFCFQAGMRRLRRILRAEGMAFHRPVSQGDLALQQQVQGR
jgi:hypothetical protein